VSTSISTRLTALLMFHCRLGLTKTGQGARIESISRGVISLIVPGGSEDVMIDLGVREALKLSKDTAKRAPKL
jgi:hypothetical protein